MTKLEDRLRQDLPALVDLLMEDQASQPEKAGRELADGLGLVLGLSPRPARARRRWLAVALATAAVAVIVGVAARLLNVPDYTNVSTVDPAAAPASGATADADDPMSQELSTSPGRQWNEIDPPFKKVYGLQSVGDGRILARVRDDSGERAVVTTNGTDWADLPIPGGIRPEHVDISGGRWLVTGFDPIEDADSSYDPGGRIFYSDDEGDHWNELVLDFPYVAATGEPFVVERRQRTSAVVSGQRIVIAISTSTGLDVLPLIVDRGLAPDVESIANVMVWPDGGMTIERRHADGSGSETIEVTPEELGLTPGQRTVVEDIFHDDRVRIFSSDGSALEQVAEYEGSGIERIATADGFMLYILGPEVLVVASPDGDVWTEIPLGPDLVFSYAPRAVDGRGSIWTGVGSDGAATLVKRLDLGAAPKTVAIQRGIRTFGRLAAGPAGLAATALPAVDDVTDPGATPGASLWTAPDVLVGWSVDGVEWEWANVEEAFGISEGLPWSQLAVGSDFVLAIVDVHQEPGEITEVGQPQVGSPTRSQAADTQPQRWFIASVP